MKKIIFVCHGNICRSPMAEFVFKNMVEKAGLSDCFEICSAATSTEEIGNPVHHGTRKKLAQFGISTAGKRAIQFTKNDYDKYDLIIVMDQANLRNLGYIIGSDTKGKVCKLLDFCGGGDIADPWWTGDFDKTYDDVERGCKALLSYLTERE